MYRSLLTVLFVAATAHTLHSEHGNERRVKVLSVREIAEKIDGVRTVATTVEVTIPPGQAGSPHRHPGPVFGYVIEGEYDWAIDDKPVQTLKAGETFYEPTRCLHRVSKNPSDRNKTRILAVVLHDSEIKDIVIPEKSEGK